MDDDHVYYYYDSDDSDDSAETLHDHDLLSLAQDNADRIAVLQRDFETLRAQLDAELARSLARVTGDRVPSSKHTVRATYSSTQLEALKAAYAADCNPSMDTRRLLAHDVGLDMRQVNNWFCNRRKRARE